MIRLDQALVERGLLSSRAKAKEAILSSAVSVNGSIVNKPAFSVSDEDELLVFANEICPYVSRGGLKLEGALSAFSLSVRGKTAIDIGASTGGFTDCLLQHGAGHVYAVDAGSMQLAEALASDDRVTVMEKYNARYLLKADFPLTPEFAVMDVSFISQTLIHPSLAALLPTGADLITLIKPQFECGRAALGKKGIVKEEKDRKNAIERVKRSAEACGFSFVAIIQSPITGGDGNVEYLAHFKKIEA